MPSADVSTGDDTPAFGDESEDTGGDFGGDATDSEDMGNDFGAEDAGGGSEKPFDDEPFDAGVQADEETDPKKFIQQLSGKLGNSLRKYSEDEGTPDLELEKFAINSLISATHTGQMDGNDQKEIIEKLKAAGKDGSEDGLNPDSGEDTGDSEDAGFGGDEENTDTEDAGSEEDTFGGDEDVEENMIVDSDDPSIEAPVKTDPMDEMYVAYVKPYGTEKPFTIHTPNGIEKFEYCWAQYPDGRNDIGVYAYRGDIVYGYKWFRKHFLNIKEEVENVVIEYEENIAENLPIGKKFSTFVENIIMSKMEKEVFLRETVEEVFNMIGTDVDTDVDNAEPGIETPVKKPGTKEKEPDTAPTRRNKPWRVPRIKENPDPKANM